MSDPSATSAMGEGRDPDGTGVPLARSYPPGSRLRQALDLARRSRDGGEPPIAAAEAVPVAAPADPVPEPQPEREPEPPPVVVVPDQPSTPAVEKPAAEARPPRSPRRRGLGRGLEALIPTNGTAIEEATWDTAVQGWVQTDDGSLEWRPIVTTLQRLDQWEVATYVGIVTGQGISRSAGDDTAAARNRAVRRMVDSAVARGAHGVIGVSLEHVIRGTEVIVTASGTSVTLVNRR